MFNCIYAWITRGGLVSFTKRVEVLTLVKLNSAIWSGTVKHNLFMECKLFEHDVKQSETWWLGCETKIGPLWNKIQNYHKRRFAFYIWKS